MKIVILQPSYMPWIGYFDLIHKADRFVFYDNVQYTKRDWRSRNKIKTPEGAKWITVPISGGRNQLLNEAIIDYTQHWVDKHLGRIKHNYSKSKYFDKYFTDIEKLLKLPYKSLIQLNITLIQYFCDMFELTPNFMFSSEIDTHQVEPTKRLIEIILKLNGTEYITGNAAKNYIDENIFKEYGIKLTYHNYKHPIYNQLYGEFVPYLSILDLLFNEGNDKDFIIGKKGLQ